MIPMEEGPEPHEWVEKAAEEQHHGQGHETGESRPEMITSAITAAVLAVMAAIGSLLSGHAANQAILDQTLATDQWSYFQAKSTRGHIAEANAEMLEALAGVQGTARPEAIRPALDRLREQMKRYDREKEEVKAEAERLEADSRHEFARHHRFAIGIAAFQVGIVLSSVSILVRFRPLYYLSVVAGVIGIAFLMAGLVG
jgi:hypothetical protein